MSGRKLDASEWRAANAVAALVGGEPEPRDVDGAPDGTYDFDIVRPNAGTLALEITTPEVGAVIALMKAALGRTHKAPGLAHDWWLGVHLESEASIPRIVKKAPRSLEVLEKQGAQQVHTHTPIRSQTRADPVVDAAQSLFALGVSRATSLAESDDPEILFSVHRGVGGAPEQINALVEEHARRNIIKLRRASGAGERHLFLTIPPSQAGAELAMATLPPPSMPPTLPSDLDVVWVANWHEKKIWRVRAGAGWEVLDAPPGG